jgi:hypothetical protein
MKWLLKSAEQNNIDKTATSIGKYSKMVKVSRLINTRRWSGVATEGIKHLETN